MVTGPRLSRLRCPVRNSQVMSCSLDDVRIPNPQLVRLHGVGPCATWIDARNLVQHGAKHASASCSTPDRLAVTYPKSDTGSEVRVSPQRAADHFKQYREWQWIKHLVFKDYLWPWAHKLGSIANDIYVVDAFAERAAIRTATIYGFALGLQLGHRVAVEAGDRLVEQPVHRLAIKATEIGSGLTPGPLAAIGAFVRAAAPAS